MNTVYDESGKPYMRHRDGARMNTTPQFEVNVDTTLVEVCKDQWCFNDDPDNPVWLYTVSFHKLDEPAWITAGDAPFIEATATENHVFMEWAHVLRFVTDAINQRLGA